MEIKTFRLTDVETINDEKHNFVIETIYRGVVTCEKGWFIKKTTEREVFGTSWCGRSPSTWKFCDTGKYTPGFIVEELVHILCCGKPLSQFKTEAK